MTRMTGPDCVVMCNLINTYIHTYIHTDGIAGGSAVTWRGAYEYTKFRHQHGEEDTPMLGQADAR